MAAFTKRAVGSLSAAHAATRAIRHALLEGPDTLFESRTRNELPALAIPLARSFRINADMIGLEASCSVLKDNWQAMADNPIKFLTTKKDNKSISKLATTLFLAINGLAAWLIAHIATVDPERLLKGIGIELMANLLAATAIFVLKTSSRARESIAAGVDELTKYLSTAINAGNKSVQ